MSDSIRRDAEFADVDYETWKAEAERSLRGGSFDKRLVSHTLDGIRVEPLYLDRPGDGTDHAGVPGLAPYTRGPRAVPSDDGWEIRQELRNPSLKGANTELLLDLERGVSGVRVVPDRGFAVGHSGEVDDGVAIRTLEDALQVFEGVHLHMIGAAIEGEMNAPSALALLAATARKHGSDTRDLRGTVGYDPISQLAADGSLGTSISTSMMLGSAMVAWTRANAPGVRPVEVAGTTWHDGGASEAQEIALSIASAIAYLRGLTDNGLSVDDTAQGICFIMASGRDTFLTIAKLRAMRRLWSRVVEVSGGSSESQRISMHARSSRVTWTQRDPWVNMLRATSQTFAAATAGCDSVTIAPYDEAIGHPDVFSRRIARNTQLILRDESYLGNVVDPAGGSYYLETLTEQIAERAWELVQDLESNGGIVDGVRSGRVAAMLQKTQDARATEIARRKMPLTGVSEFPNIEEAPVDTPVRRAHPTISETEATNLKNALGQDPAVAAVIDAAIADIEAGASSDALLSALEATGEIEEAPRLHFERYAHPWEALRDAVERTGEDAPTVFLCNIGKIPQHRARASFAQNLFQAAGLPSPNNDGFPGVDEAVAAFNASGAAAACICSEDAVYADVVPALAAALKDAGAKRVFVAGNPREHRDAWTAAGVDDFIYMGRDVLEALRDTLTALGIELLVDEEPEEEA